MERKDIGCDGVIIKKEGSMSRLLVEWQETLKKMGGSEQPVGFVFFQKSVSIKKSQSKCMVGRDKVFLLS